MTKVVANIALCVSVIICCWLGAETFVLPAKKNSSVGSLKEECLKIDAEILRLSFRIKSIMSEIDAATLTNSIETSECPNTVLLSHAKRSQLDAYLDQLNQFKERLESFEQALQNHLRFMKIVSNYDIKVFDDTIVHSAIGVPVA